MFRSLFEIYFDDFSLKIANILGFRSASAQSYCRKATDRHKSWDMIHVAFNGTLDKLLVPYVLVGQNMGDIWLNLEVGYNKHFLVEYCSRDVPDYESK